MTIDEILKLLETASKYKVRELSYDGLKVILDYQQNSIQQITPTIWSQAPLASQMNEFNLDNAQKFEVHNKVYTELKPEDILKPPAHLDKLSEEEILYAATPYFDEIQAKKQMHEEKLKNDSI